MLNPYGGKNSGGNSTIAKNAWGVYPDWGGGDETFLACDPFVVWAFKQAGLNIYANRDKMRKFTDKIWTNKDGSTQPYFEYKAEGYSKPVNVNYFFVGVTCHIFQKNLKKRNGFISVIAQIN